MADRESLESMLTEGLKYEKLAEDNCAKIEKQLAVDGFYQQIDKIKNDEIQHQQIVQQLIDMLK